MTQRLPHVMLDHPALAADQPLRLTRDRSPAPLSRIAAHDLGAARRQRLRLQRDLEKTYPRGFSSCVDITIHVAEDAPTARREMAELGGENLDGLVYVGTSRGLAGLISDVVAAGVADGAVLRLAIPDSTGALGRLVDEVMPKLFRDNDIQIDEDAAAVVRRHISRIEAIATPSTLAS
jgi:hypothetical protein